MSGWFIFGMVAVAATLGPSIFLTLGTGQPTLARHVNSQGQRVRTKRKSVPPPDNKVPPLVGGPVTRRIARKL